MSSCPLSPPGELQRSARSSGGLKNNHGENRVHFKSLDAAKGKKRSKSRPGSPGKKNLRKSGDRRAKRPSLPQSEDSDGTEETRLVAPGCAGCAAEDGSSSAPVIQRITVSREDAKIMDEKTMKKQRAKQHLKMHKLSVSVKKSHGRSNSSLEKRSRSISSKKARRAGT